MNRKKTQLIKNNDLLKRQIASFKKSASLKEKRIAGLFVKKSVLFNKCEELIKENKKLKNDLKISDKIYLISIDHRLKSQKESYNKGKIILHLEEKTKELENENFKLFEELNNRKYEIDKLKIALKAVRDSLEYYEHLVNEYKKEAEKTSWKMVELTIENESLKNNSFKNKVKRILGVR